MTTSRIHELQLQRGKTLEDIANVDEQLGRSDVEEFGETSLRLKSAYLDLLTTIEKCIQSELARPILEKAARVRENYFKAEEALMTTAINSQPSEGLSFTECWNLHKKAEEHWWEAIAECQKFHSEHPGYSLR